MPFERAVVELQHFTRTDVSRPTVERTTEAAGAAYVKVQEREVEQLEREAPTPPAGPAQQFLSVDGAMVPLVGGEWAEVKTLAIGEVEPPKQHKGETVIQTRDMSYFSRLTDSNTFQRLALVETHRPWGGNRGGGRRGDRWLGAVELLPSPTARLRASRVVSNHHQLTTHLQSGGTAK
jgi:hypothetical protein